MENLDIAVANQLATGAPGTITLGGRDYLVSQVTEHTAAAVGLQIQKVAKRQWQAKVRQAIQETGSIKAAQELLDALGEEPVKGDSTAGFNSAVATAEGCRCLALALLREHEPALTIDALAKLIDEDNAAVIAGELLVESGMGKLNPNSRGATSSTGAASPTSPTAAGCTASSASSMASPPGASPAS